MSPEPENLQERTDRFVEGLRRSGVKLTPQRLEIFREVAKSSDHPDVDTIYRGVRERIPSVSLDTVYRTLWLLSDLGLIDTLGPSHGKARFDANVHPHHHFTCIECGKTHDFYSEEFDRLKVPNSVKALGIVEKTQVEMRGVCADCRKRDGKD